VGTLESLAHACSLSEHEDHALKYYNESLERLYEQDEDNRERQALIMFKMSKIHQNLGELEAQFEKLHLASKILQADRNSPKGMTLERQIEAEMARVRQTLQKQGREWV
jgi:hypothetical protein